MFGLSPKFIRTMSIVIGIGCLCGVYTGGLFGVVLFGPAETLIQGIAAFLVYAPSGGIIGACIGGLTVLYVTYCAAMNSKESE